MTSASRWGALVVASLPLASLGCSSAAAPTPTPALPPPPTPTAVASAAPAPPPPRLASFVDLFASAPAPSAGESSSGRASVARMPYGRGVFSHRTYQAWGRHGTNCPVAREEGCGTFSLRTGATAPALWPPGPTDAAPADDKLVERGPFVAPHAWVAFAGGLDAVYALREGGKHIDRIDDQGKVTPFVSDDAMAGWSELWVIERQGKLLVAGMGAPRRRRPMAPSEDNETRTGWQLAEVIEGGPGGARRLGPLTELPMRPMTSRLNAQGARTAAADGKMAAVRLPEVLALPDDGAQKDRWAMVWLEVIAPDYSWPHGKPQKGVKAAPAAPGAPASGSKGTKGARHGCGGPSSRRLEDASVTKRAHVTRFAGAKLLDDTVQWTAGSVGDVLSLPLTTKLEGDQLSVALPGKTRAAPSERSRPHWAGDDDEDLKLAHNEEITTFRFDPVAGEGLVIVRDHDRLLSRRFDAAGQPLGEPVVLKPTAIDEVTHSKGKWYALGDSPTALYNLTDQTGPFELPASRSSYSLVTTEQGVALLEVEGQLLRTIALGPTGVTGPATTLDDLPLTLDASRAQVLPLKGGSILVVFESRQGEENRDKVAWRPLSAGAAWQRVELPSREPVQAYQLEFRPVHDDVVATIDRGDKQGFVWLRAGKSTFREVPRAERRDQEPTESLTAGPLLGGGLRLPSEPGLPVADEALVGAGKYCQLSLPTSATTVVLACVHATDPVVPGLRVALRTLTLAPAR